MPAYCSARPDPVPWWGPLPLWVLVVIFGRELFMTAFRAYAGGETFRAPSPGLEADVADGHPQQIGDATVSGPGPVADPPNGHGWHGTES